MIFWGEDVDEDDDEDDTATVTAEDDWDDDDNDDDEDGDDDDLPLSTCPGSIRVEWCQIGPGYWQEMWPLCESMSDPHPDNNKNRHKIIWK